MNEQEKNDVMKDKFAELDVAIRRVWSDIFVVGSNYNDPGLYEEAVKALEAAENFVSVLEELDENLDVDHTSIPSLDKFFEGNPVTEYIEAKLEFMNSKEEDKNAELRLSNAAKKVKEQQGSHELDVDEVLNYAASIEQDYLFQSNVVMDMVEELLEGVESFSKKDIELIRFYLKQLPNNSSYDIDALDDSVVALAWNQRKLAQGEL
jgi:hypothetical protein